MKKCCRCGMCCYTGECDFGNETGRWGRCSYLIVNEDHTTTCSNKKANAAYLGVGCPLRNNDHVWQLQVDIYAASLEKYKLHVLSLQRYNSKGDEQWMITELERCFLNY